MSLTRNQRTIHLARARARRPQEQTAHTETLQVADGRSDMLRNFMFVFLRCRWTAARGG